MTDTTTVSLKETTKSDLDGLKRVEGESYDSVVRMLIASYGDDSKDAITDHNGGQELDAEELAAIADALATVEERTGRIERLLDEVTGR